MPSYLGGALIQLQSHQRNQFAVKKWIEGSLKKNA